MPTINVQELEDEIIETAAKAAFEKSRELGHTETLFMEWGELNPEARKDWREVAWAAMTAYLGKDV